MDRLSSKFTSPKGGATPAIMGSGKVQAVIWNSSESKKSGVHDPLGKFGLPPLEQAVAKERGSMLEYIAKKQRESAARLGIRTN